MPSYPDEVRAAERAAMRKRRRRGRGKIGMSTLRVFELNRLFTHRYGHVLPDDDAGRADVRLMVHHISRRYAAPAPHVDQWLEQRAPWFTGEERERLVLDAIEYPLKFKADTLGRLLRLTADERALLKIRTIGPHDSTAAERKQARRQAGIERKRAERRSKGIGPRQTPQGPSLNARAPWKALKISRRTWFRRSAKQRNGTATPQYSISE